MKKLIIVMSILFLCVSCATTNIKKSEINSKVDEIKILKPKYPRKDTLNPQIRENTFLIKKAINSIDSLVVGLSEIEKKKSLFPNVYLKTIKITSPDDFFKAIQNVSGWKFILRDAENHDIPLKEYEYVNLYEVIRDLSKIFHSEVIANFKTHTIIFTNQISKTYFFPIFSGEEDIELKNQPSTLGDIGGSTGGSTQTSGDEDSAGKFKIKKKGELLKEVAEVLQEFSGIKKVLISTPTNEIIIRGSIEGISRADRYLKKLINELSLQIEVFLTIAEIRWTSDNDRRKFFNMLHQNASEVINSTVGSAASGSLLTFSYTKTTPEDTISFILGLANNYGKSKIITNTRTLVQNSYPITLFSGRIIQYVQSTTTTFQDTRQITTPETGTVSDGLTLHMIPRYIGDDKILFVVIPRLSTVTFKNYNYSNSSSLSLPASRVHQQYVRFIANSGAVNIFGAVQYGSSSLMNQNLSLFNIPIGGTELKERRDVLFILMGRLVDLSGNYLNNKN